MTGMTDTSVTTRISGDAQVAGISRNRFLGLLRRSDFSGQRKKAELLPLNAANCACSRPLTKNGDEETITINRPGRSTYPEEKSVLTSGATPTITINRPGRSTYPEEKSVLTSGATPKLWFSKIERDVIARGVFTSLADLMRKLMKYIRHYN